MKEALSASETSVLTRATRHNIPENAILHSHRRENLKPYIEVLPLLYIQPLNTDSYCYTEQRLRGCCVRERFHIHVTRMAENKTGDMSMRDIMSHQVVSQAQRTSRT
jgi:hypothetical protein